MRDRCELNMITVAAHTMLLTRTGGVAVHLTWSAGDEDDAQPASPSDCKPTTTRRNIDPGADLDKMAREPRWASRTLGGVRWNLIAGSDPKSCGTDLGRAPTCRRCLAIVDRWFPTPSTTGSVCSR
jgi:hypothetical protein